MERWNKRLLAIAEGRRPLVRQTARVCKAGADEERFPPGGSIASELDPKKSIGKEGGRGGESSEGGRVLG